jgi:hypothetical protein
MCSHGQSADGGYATLNPGAGAKWIKHLTRDRLNNFNGGHFSDVNLSAALFTHRLDGDEHVKLSVWSAPGRSKPGFDEAMKQEFKPAHKGDSFGPSCASCLRAGAGRALMGAQGRTTGGRSRSRSRSTGSNTTACSVRPPHACLLCFSCPRSRVRPGLRSHDLQHGRHAPPRHVSPLPLTNLITHTHARAQASPAAAAATGASSTSSRRPSAARARTRS